MLPRRSSSAEGLAWFALLLSRISSPAPDDQASTQSATSEQRTHQALVTHAHADVRAPRSANARPANVAPQGGELWHGQKAGTWPASGGGSAGRGWPSRS